MPNITYTIDSSGRLSFTLNDVASLKSPALTGSPTAPTQSAGDNSTKLATTAYVDRLGARSYLIFPIGHIEECLKSTAPVQTLLLQGQLISRVTYADLWNYANASGNIVSEATWTATNKGGFSVGDGSTTFRLPDLRDQFLRGASGTRVLGTSQTDATQGHYHTLATGGVTRTGGGDGIFDALNTNPTGGYTNRVTSPISDGTNGTPRTANETRPVNIAVNYIIVY